MENEIDKNVKVSVKLPDGNLIELKSMVEVGVDVSVLLDRELAQLPPGVKCRCGCNKFFKSDLPARDGLPKVRGIQCSNCKELYWKEMDVIKYEKAARRLKYERKQ